MFNRIVLICLLVVSGSVLAGVQPASKSVSPLFWQLDYQGKTSYAFGSIHLGEKHMYPLPQPIMAGFKASEALVVEVDLAKIKPADMSAMTMRYGVDDKRPLSSWLNPSTKKQYHQYCNKQQLPCDRFATFKPWLVGVTLMSISFSQSGFDSELGIDKFFIQRSKGKKPIIALESAEQQLGLLSGLSGEIQQELLVQSMQSDNAMMLELINSWYSGDEHKLIELFGQVHDKGLEKVFREQFLVQRNKTMVEKLMPQLKAGKQLFVVVGTAHLVGPDNMLALLKRRGVTVTQVATARASKQHHQDNNQ